MDQPSWDDDVFTWRRFAGDLRQRMGAAYRSASEADARAAEAEQRAVEAEAIADSARASARRNRWHLTRVEKLLSEGDTSGAVALLAKRRSRIDAGIRRRQDERP